MHRPSGAVAHGQASLARPDGETAARQAVADASCFNVIIRPSPAHEQRRIFGMRQPWCARPRARGAKGGGGGGGWSQRRFVSFFLCCFALINLKRRLGAWTETALPYLATPMRSFILTNLTHMIHSEVERDSAQVMITACCFQAVSLYTEATSFKRTITYSTEHSGAGPVKLRGIQRQS